VFCGIVAGELPASVVYVDDEIMAFLDIRPVNPGHVLVIPRSHAAELSDLDPHIGGRMFQVAQDMTAAIRRSELRCDGVNLFLADGEAAGQEVFHSHLHVLPRYRGDKFRLEPNWPPPPGRKELDRIAAQLRLT